jgi:hypothetical protein
MNGRQYLYKFLEKHPEPLFNYKQKTLNDNKKKSSIWR